MGEYNVSNSHDLYNDMFDTDLDYCCIGSVGISYQLNYIQYKLQKHYPGITPFLGTCAVFRPFPFLPVQTAETSSFRRTLSQPFASLCGPNSQEIRGRQILRKLKVHYYFCQPALIYPEDFMHFTRELIGIPWILSLMQS